jgi:hypothetical protein
MKFRIGLESGDENRSISWVLGHPGCFAYGPDPDSALAAAHQAIHDYQAWVAARGDSWLEGDEVEVQAVERWDVFFVNENYEPVGEGYAVNAWFLDDWKPLAQLEVDRGLKILEWTRKDLLQTVRGLDQARLERTYPGERWSISGLLKHVANAEWWYLDRLGLGFARHLLHDGVDERLEKVRTHLVDVLPNLVGNQLVVGTEAEFWSPRKLLRRAAWHERDHTFHIQKLLAAED